MIRMVKSIRHKWVNVMFLTIPETVEVCEEVLHGPSGAIVSPDTDGDGFYDDNVYCNWIVVATENHVIRYEFIYFDVESSDSCVKDRVLVGFVEANASRVPICNA